MSKARVLFLCTGNSARSQMAEAYLRKHGGEHFEVHSAGIEPRGLNPLSVRVMEEAGFDMSGHRSKSTREYLGHVNFGYVITLCDDAEENCPTIFLTVSHRYFWPFEDPAAVQGSEDARLRKFRDVRDQIEQRVLAWLKELDLAPKAEPDARTLA